MSWVSSLLILYLVVWVGFHAAQAIVDIQQWWKMVRTPSVPNILALYAIPALALASGTSLAGDIVPVTTIVFFAIDFACLVGVLRERAEARSYGMLWFAFSVWSWSIRLGWMAGLLYWINGGAIWPFI